MYEYFYVFRFIMYVFNLRTAGLYLNTAPRGFNTVPL